MRGDRILLVRQVDHQEQCALMADAWGTAEFARPEPFAPLREATSLHDEGWRSWEQRPEVSDQGLPVDFPDLDRKTHIALYTAGIETVCARGDRAGLIASLHGRGLYEKRLGLDGPAPPREERPIHEREFIAQELSRQQRLSARIGLEDPLAPWAWSSYRLLQAWDALSLFLLWAGLPRGAEAVLPRVPRHQDDDAGVPIRLIPAGPDTGALDPYPFGDSEVELPVAARWIENRCYSGGDDLAATLAGTPWTIVRVGVTRR
ncbi:MAG: DUF3891 family protein [Thermoleophilia bacterium]|nr:DUF3891 family protein [Thermoleophilia bacterium]